MFVAIALAVFLIIIVLLQSSKGGGLAGTFGGAGGAGGMGSMFGARRTADFLSRATWWIGGSLLVLAILINLFFLPSQLNEETRESIIQRSQQQAVPTSPALPQQQSVPQQNTEQPDEGAQSDQQ